MMVNKVRTTLRSLRAESGRNGHNGGSTVGEGKRKIARYYKIHLFNET